MIFADKHLFKASNETNRKSIGRHSFSAGVKDWALSLAKVIQRHWNSTGQHTFFWTRFFFEWLWMGRDEMGKAILTKLFSSYK